MKKLLLLLFLIPNLVLAETWVCSYLHNENIESSIYKRDGRTFINKFESSFHKIDPKKYPKKTITTEYEILYENDFQIKLIESDTSAIGIWVVLLTKTNQPTFISSHVTSLESPNWKGNCDVVE